MNFKLGNDYERWIDQRDMNVGQIKKIWKKYSLIPTHDDFNTSSIQAPVTYDLS